MKALKFIDFCLNEGASILDNGNVWLSWRDDADDEFEFLKSNRTNNTIRAGRNSDMTGYRIWYGLTVGDEFKRELESETNDEFVELLHKLKSGKIENLDRSLYAFIHPTAMDIKKAMNMGRDIDYIFPMGSTQVLSKTLADEFAKLNNGSETVDLSKYQFKSVVDAIDWDYIQDYEENRVGRPQQNNPNKTVKSILPTLITNVILKNIDVENSAQDIVDKLKGASNWKHLKGMLLTSNPNNRYYKKENHITWKDEAVPFTIRSSSISIGGDRQYLKSKYNTPKSGGIFGDPKFIQAIENCVFRGKTMLLIDDNTRSKKDLYQIFDSINQIADNMIADADIEFKPGSNISRYKERIGAYVLIYIPTTIKM